MEPEQTDATGAGFGRGDHSGRPRGGFQLPQVPLCQHLEVLAWLMPMTGRHSRRWLLPPAWQPVLTPFPARRPLQGCTSDQRLNARGSPGPRPTVLHRHSAQGDDDCSHSPPPHAVCQGQPRILVPAGLPHGSAVPAPDGWTDTRWLPHAPGNRGSDVYPPRFCCVENEAEGIGDSTVGQPHLARNPGPTDRQLSQPRLSAI